MNTQIIAQSFLRGYRLALALDKALEDGDHWITVNTEGGRKGQHVLLSGSGRVKAGMGGKFNGVKIDNIPRKNYINENAWQRKQKTVKGEMDYTLPAKVRPDYIQNRDRGGATSFEQILSIAKKPDYARLSVSNTLADGAPVVAFGSIPKENLGRVAKATDANGNKINVQYAVMEAQDIQASHDERGNRNKKFYSDDPNLTRAVAGNGRIAALQHSYAIGKAGEYKDDLIDDDYHGVDVSVISRMKNPVLVRVMQPKDVTADIGDRSNTVSNLTLSAIEQAKNDTTRIDLKGIETYSDGTPTLKAVSQFIDDMPVSERGNMRDRNGYPTRQAQERLQSAIFAKAYGGSDVLLEQAYQAVDPEQAKIIKGLQGAAAAVATANSKEASELITAAAERTLASVRAGNKVKDAEWLADMFKDDDQDRAEMAIAGIFGRSKSSKEIREKIIAVAEAVKKEKEKPDFDLFGAVEKLPMKDVIVNALRRYEETN